jgi:energy-coupling factor transporter ATP-binding protein EcfA2
MRILKFEASNFKRLVSVAIEPNGSIVQLRGSNGAGKSSCLDAIMALLGGEKFAPEVPIRQGSEAAEVSCVINDITVTKKWTTKGVCLEVLDATGLKVKSPQEMLSKLAGPLGFDPLAFTRYDAKKQLQMLKDLVGLDFSDLDSQHADTFAERTIVNREVARYTAQVPSPVLGEVPANEVSASSLVSELDTAQAIKNKNDLKRAELEKLRAESKRIADEIMQLQKRQSEIRETGLKLAEEVKGIVDPDIEKLRSDIKNVEARNAKFRQKQKREATLKILKEKQAEAEELTAKLKAIAAERAIRLASAKFPVDGLGFGDTGISYNGLPFSQSSQAEQLRVSIAIAIAMNPKLRIVLIRDGSLLDDKSMALVYEMAEKQDLQVWIEIVGEGPVGIIIEDGMVANAKM